MATTSDAEIEKVGEFDISSKALFIGDPSLQHLNGSVMLEKVLNGRWSAFVSRLNIEGIGERTLQVMALHNDYAKIADDLFFDDPMTIEVASGSVGILDLDLFNSDQSDVDWELERQTYLDSPIQASIGGGIGVIAMTGLGDGKYQGTVAYNIRGDLVGVSLVFITDEDLQKRTPGKVT